MSHISRTACVAAAIALLSLGGEKQLQGEDKPAAKSPQAWTLDEALAQLKLNPKDAYLQYVVLQLARRDNHLDETAKEVDQLLQGPRWQEGRRNDVDLFSIFTGALAVQESLQLDTMRGERPRQARFAPPPQTEDQQKEQAAALEKRRQEVVDIGTLSGPTIKSHPWEKMLAGKKPDLSPLARYVPDDYFFAEFRSLNKLLEVMEVSDQWGTHLFNQAVHEARTQRVGDRLKTQLAVETNPLLRPFYDLVVQQVAVTGSDLFVREGGDVTLLFKIKQPEVFKARMDGFLSDAAKARPDAKRRTGEYVGIAYDELTTPDREVSVFSAYPAPDLHVRSNSKVAFQRVLEAVKGKSLEGKEVRRLGDTAEFSYIRTLMPPGAREEDGFVYLSDPFIRRLVGPQLKLTERHRMLCYNHLRMIGHAALMYRTEFGKAPDSLRALVEARCSPGTFGEGALACPDGGTYTLSADGLTAVCSEHGRAGSLTPCCEVPVAKANGEEADEYKAFLEEYNQYWKTYFDPIALRIQISPEHFRLETIVLPLIDNSIYTGMATVLGGEPEPLDALPVPKKEIFSLAVRINKEELLKKAREEFPEQAMDETLAKGLMEGLGLPEKDAKNLKSSDVTEFVTHGLGNQVGLHVYDSVPTFDLNLASFFGELAGTFSNRSVSMEPTALLAGFVGTSLTSPVYLSIPVQDEKIVDGFLDKLDPVFIALAHHPQGNGWFGVETDFYKITHPSGQVIRGNGIKFGPITWRYFSARIGSAFYISSKLSILEDLIALEAERKAGGAPGGKETDRGPAAHAMVRIRADNWNQVLPDFRLAWAENNRLACLDNLGPLSSVARAFITSRAGKPGEGDQPDVHQQADRLHTVHFFCPEGGEYLLAPDGKSVTCSIHGSVLSPRQAAAPAENTDLGKLLHQFGGMTLTLTFLQDGLHAVATIDRK